MNILITILIALFLMFMCVSISLLSFVLVCMIEKYIMNKTELDKEIWKIE